MDNDNKFKSVLQDRVDKDRENAKKDAALRKEYGIEDGRTVGIKVVKKGTVTSLWDVLCEIIRILFNIILFGLALIGLMSLLHPDIRSVFMIIIGDTMEQIKLFAPFLPI